MEGVRMDVLKVFAVVGIVSSVVMMVLHSAVVFVLKKRGMIAPERTYRSERTIGTAAWLILIVVMAWILWDTVMSPVFHLSVMMIVTVLLGGIGATMFGDDVAFYRRNERQRVESLARC